MGSGRGHLGGIPADIRWRNQLRVQAPCDGAFHPGSNALTLDHLGTFCMVRIKSHRGGADGQGQQAVLVQCRKAHGNGAPNRLANEVDSGQLQLVQELQEVLGKILQGPGIARRRD